VSHSPLYGPTDVAALLRGHEQYVLDLVYSPHKAMKLLERTRDIFCDITEMAWARIPLYEGGYFDAQYQLWAPGPIARLQEDAVAIYSPKLYHEFVQPIDRAVARRFACCFMHLHGTSMFLLDEILEVEELSCFEVNLDVGGLDVDAMIPYFRTIQHAGRSLLIRGSFTEAEADRLMSALEPRGLYVYCMVGSIDEIKVLKPIFGLS
jgi:hypothetical protein